MKIDKRTIIGKSLLEEIDSNSYFAKVQYQEDLEKSSCLILDPQREYRMKSMECINCYYTSRMCGSGFTTYSCKICLKQDDYPNTCTPKLCMECAKDNTLCRRCMCNINFKK